MAALFILHTKWHTLEHLKEYQAGARTTLAEFGARQVAYDPRTEIAEGESPLTATVILEFKDLEPAKAWYHSPGYQAVLPLRLKSSDGIARFVETADRVIRDGGV